MGIQMSRKYLNKTFTMIFSWEKTFGLQGFYKKIKRFKDLSPVTNPLLWKLQ